MRRWTFTLLMIACGGDSDGGDTTSVGSTCPNGTGCAEDTNTATTAADSSGSGSASGSASGAATTAAESSTGDEETGAATFMPMDASGEGPSDESGTADCAMMPDCASCWQCAETGPCEAAYQGCASQAYCAPSLVCVESQCAGDGLMQPCVDNCCISCTMLGTCPGVDGAITCIEGICAAHCGMVSCP